MTVHGGVAVLCRKVRKGCSDEVTFEQKVEGSEWGATCISAGRGFQVEEQSEQRPQSGSMCSVSGNCREDEVSEVERAVGQG